MFRSVGLSCSGRAPKKSSARKSSGIAECRSYRSTSFMFRTFFTCARESRTLFCWARSENKGRKPLVQRSRESLILAIYRLLLKAAALHEYMVLMTSSWTSCMQHMSRRSSWRNNVLRYILSTLALDISEDPCIYQVRVTQDILLHHPE